MKVGVLLCYGHLEETNTEYCDYVKWVLNDCLTESLDKLILCGGHTNSLQPAVSEAESVSAYIQKLGSNFPIEREDESLTTPQNLEFVSQKVSDTDSFVVYCDLARLAKVVWLSLSYLLHSNRQQISHILFDFFKDKKVKPFEHKNLKVKYFEFPSRDKYQYLAQSFSSLLEVEGLYDPSLEEKIVAQRKIDFKI